MWPYVIAGLAGALFAKRSSPKSKIIKKESIGSRSGRNYTIDDATMDGGFIVVHDMIDGSVASFQRNKDGKFVFGQARGNPNTIKIMINDFTESLISHQDKI